MDTKKNESEMIQTCFEMAFQKADNPLWYIGFACSLTSDVDAVAFFVFSLIFKSEYDTCLSHKGVR